MTGFDIAVGLRENNNWDPKYLDLTGYVELNFAMFGWNGAVLPTIYN